MVTATIPSNLTQSCQIELAPDNLYQLYAKLNSTISTTNGSIRHFRFLQRLTNISNPCRGLKRYHQHFTNTLFLVSSPNNEIVKMHTVTNCIKRWINLKDITYTFNATTNSTSVNATVNDVIIFDRLLKFLAGLVMEVGSLMTSTNFCF
ncbi:uncharacterized protein [Antedon mediterranea]